MHENPNMNDPDETGLRSGKGTGFFSRLLFWGKTEDGEEKEKDPKLWKIDDHRVKRKKYKQKWGHRGQTGTERINGFMCVDCEKKEAHRNNFKHKECFEVLQE